MKHQNLPIANSNFPVILWHGTQESAFLGIDDLWHEHLELWFLRKGSVTFSINSVLHKVSEGELVIVNPNEVHSFIKNSDSITYDCIVVSPQFLRSGIDIEDLIRPVVKENKIFQKAGADKTIENNCFVLQNYVTDSNVVCFFDKIVEEAEEKNIGFEIAIRGYLCELIVYLYRNYIRSSGGTDKGNIKKLIPAVTYINNHYKETISYKELAKISNFSQKYFCRLFKSVMQKTVVEYVNELRIFESLTLLEKTDLPITEIAYQTGFNDLNYFGRIFKKMHNCTPKEYRRNRRQSINIQKPTDKKDDN